MVLEVVLEVLEVLLEVLEVLLEVLEVVLEVLGALGPKFHIKKRSRYKVLIRSL